MGDDIRIIAGVKEKSPVKRAFKPKKSLGNDLLSQGVAPQVPSALTALTTGFGM
jgi:hypothetical protein